MIRDHRKTRTGCKQCKSRRVKCDEKRPLCSGCIRNELPCSLKFLTPRVPVLISKKTRNPVKSSLKTIGPSLDASLKTTQLDPDLELMNHYIKIACFTIAHSRDMDIWQVHIPQMALSHDFLLHGILAFSALHLSTLQPIRKNELSRRASISEQIAITPFRKFVSGNDPQSIHAVFAFAGFVVPYILAQSGSLEVSSGRIPRLDDDRPHWFLVLRGFIKLTQRSWDDLGRGPFSPVLARVVDPIYHNWNPEDSKLAHICQLLEPTETASTDDKKALASCQIALDILRQVSAIPYSPCKTFNMVSGVYIWPGVVPKNFIDLLYVHRPEALVILAHYCVILKRADYCWYLKGVGVNMLIAIENELDLAWKPWIRWALDQPVQTVC